MSIKQNPSVFIREPTIEDEGEFISAMQRSQPLHSSCLKAPTTPKEFEDYLQCYKQPNQKSFLICDQLGHIAGLFHINEIVHGLFQSGYLRFYAVIDYAGEGYMSAGLKLVLNKIFTDIKLHRLEANILPEDIKSIQLVKNNGFRYEGYSPRSLKLNGQWRGLERWAITHEDYIKNSDDLLKKDHVKIVAYNSDWPNQAQVEINKLRTTLPDDKILDIQHVGSTAIRGISTKPIINIQMAVKSLDDIKELAIANFQKNGYEYWYDSPDQKRLFFIKGMPPYGEKRTHHVYIVELDSDYWRNRILFRDFLNSHPDVAKEYDKLQIQLAKIYLNDPDKFSKEKTEFIKNVINLALANKKGK
jgi:GrpB-like predicted nucleotidyltransferase (UPF0157 family)/RimJ/RimL family protein N-acetyltransferase